IHILAEQATVDGTGDKAGYLSGFGVLPAEEVRAAAKTAKLKLVRLPGAKPENGYRPSAGLKDFLQWRDLTCRFPGCDDPVERCDVDHTKPWPFGVTHASGLKHYCRSHHIVKTFLTGVNGWKDEQRPDGTIVLTAPTGHVYETEPLGGLLFPSLSVPTAPVPEVKMPEDESDKAAMMRRRSRTHEQERQARIKRERRQRIEIDGERERQHQAWLAETYEPPPF
ncbi:HNH endonuclease, partial [Mycobacterium sp. ITM-2017-0098]